MSTPQNPPNKSDSFFSLTPELILNATEEAGFKPTGEMNMLNSYENRVFEIKLEGQDPLITKIYRPGRWSRETILEEHEFSQDLFNHDIPAVPPLQLPKIQSSLLTFETLNFAFFKKQKGRMPDEFLESDFKMIGERLAQIHNIGAQKKFKHRPTIGLTPYSFWEQLEFIMPFVAPEMRGRYETAIVNLADYFEDAILNPQSKSQFIRLHGDAHRGNLLYFPPDHKFYFVDFDDCLMGPPMQDIWLLTKGYSQADEDLLIEGYETLRTLQPNQKGWTPLLQGWRIFSYACWIGRRWKDPSFPKVFPDFGTYTYWAEECEALENIVWALG